MNLQKLLSSFESFTKPGQITEKKGALISKRNTSPEAFEIKYFHQEIGSMKENNGGQFISVPIQVSAIADGTVVLLSAEFPKTGTVETRRFGALISFASKKLNKDEVMRNYGSILERAGKITISRNMVIDGEGFYPVFTDGWVKRINA